MTAKHQDKQPHIVVLYCQYALRPDTPVSDAAKSISDFTLRAEMIPCSSKIVVSNLMKILEKGADGVEIIACPTKDCQLLVGSRRAKKRVEHARSLLEESGLGADRLGISFEENLNARQLMTVVQKRADAVRQLNEQASQEGTPS